MGAIDKGHIRKEAAAAVTARPPTASTGRFDEALRRYLGAEAYKEKKQAKKEQGGSKPGADEKGRSASSCGRSSRRTT